MNHDIIEALSQIAREKGVDLQVLRDRVEASLLSAAKKKNGMNAQITVRFDEGKGRIEMFMTKTVVGTVSDRGLEVTASQARAYKAEASVGDEVVIPLDVEEFGRNAILAAKQVLIQGVREAERQRVYNDFAGRVGTIVRGVVQQVDRGSIVVKLDTAEAVIPAREIMHRDLFRQRELVRGLVIRVEDKEARGPQIILSRTDPRFLLKLFEAEVPEIADRTVEIKMVAREAGHRSKIAVVSHDSRIDAVGACVGIKGSRVQTIVKELGGERIDIVPWSADPVAFVSRALSPARVLNARVDEENHQVAVVVPDDQLSLAIGKQGQNVRLAAKLSGWKIELHSQSEFDERSAASQADVLLAELDGVTPEAVATLAAAGVQHASQVEHLGLEDLVKLPGLPEGVSERIYGLALAALANARAQAAQAAAARKAVAGSGSESDADAEEDAEEDAEAEGAEMLTEETGNPEESTSADEQEEIAPPPEAEDMTGAGTAGDEPRAASGGMS
jgi:N utilization substance protein A